MNSNYWAHGSQVTSHGIKIQHASQSVHMEDSNCYTKQLNLQRVKEIERKYMHIFIRPLLEQSSSVWHSGLTDKNVKDIERVQKAAVRVIMGSDFTDYQHALSELKITNLSERRRELSKKFALKIANNPKMQYMLPLRNEMRENIRRHTDKYIIQHANTHRLQASAIPYMQKQLNQHNKEEQDWSNIED